MAAFKRLRKVFFKGQSTQLVAVARFFFCLVGGTFGRRRGQRLVAVEGF